MPALILTFAAEITSGTQFLYNILTKNNIVKRNNKKDSRVLIDVH